MLLARSSPHEATGRRKLLVLLRLLRDIGVAHRLGGGGRLGKRLLEQQQDELKGDDDHKLGAEQVDLRHATGHDVGPARQELVTLSAGQSNGGVVGGMDV